MALKHHRYLYKKEGSKTACSLARRNILTARNPNTVIGNVRKSTYYIPILRGKGESYGMTDYNMSGLLYCSNSINRMKAKKNSSAGYLPNAVRGADIPWGEFANSYDYLRDFVEQFLGWGYTFTVKTPFRIINKSTGKTVQTVAAGATLVTRHTTSNFGYDHTWTLVVNDTGILSCSRNWAGQNSYSLGNFQIDALYLSRSVTHHIAKNVSVLSKISSYVSNNSYRYIRCFESGTSVPADWAYTWKQGNDTIGLTAIGYKTVTSSGSTSTVLVLYGTKINTQASPNTDLFETWYSQLPAKTKNSSVNSYYPYHYNQISYTIEVSDVKLECDIDFV